MTKAIPAWLKEYNRALKAAIKSMEKYGREEFRFVPPEPPKTREEALEINKDLRRINKQHLTRTHMELPNRYMFFKPKDDVYPNGMTKTYKELPIKTYKDYMRAQENRIKEMKKYGDKEWKNIGKVVKGVFTPYEPKFHNNDMLLSYFDKYGDIDRVKQSYKKKNQTMSDNMEKSFQNMIPMLKIASGGNDESMLVYTYFLEQVLKLPIKTKIKLVNYWTSRNIQVCNEIFGSEQESFSPPNLVAFIKSTKAVVGNDWYESVHKQANEKYGLPEDYRAVL